MVMANNKFPEWTLAQETDLRKYHKRGLPYSAISMLIGFTRNAISGKCFRLGLRKRTEREWFQTARKGVPRGQYRSKKPKRPKEVTKVEKLNLPPRPKIPPIIADPVVVVPLMKLEDHGCRWPIGDPKDANFGYCGYTKEPGKAYCLFHHHMGTVPDKRRVVT